MNRPIDQKIILKNTIFLYLRMFIVLAVSLFTSRIVLDKLGVEDYGIYNIVGSVVIAFAFFNNAIVSSSQRFYSYTLGKGENCSRVFSMSTNILLIMMVVLVLVLETGGLYFFNEVIDIPEGRRDAAAIVYQLTILTFVLNFLKAPYNALIIAYEKMSIYAVFSIVEVVLKLVIVYLLVFTDSDKLILYGFLMMLVSLINTIMYILYCKIRICEVKYRFIWDKPLMKEMLGFSVWNMVGGLCGIATNEGPNYLINIFHGVRLNAAVGLAKQVSGIVYQFSSNFQMAFNPQIVKLYAAGDKIGLSTLINRTSKLSFYLMFVISLPVMCSQDLFELWLKEVPEFTKIFCIFYLINQLISSITSPLWMAAHAIGNIRNYQLILSFISLLALPLGWGCLALGLHPASVILSLTITSLLVLIYRVWYLGNRIGFDKTSYYKNVVLRNLILLPLLTVPLIWWIGTKVSGFSGLILIGLSSVILVTTVFYFLCLSNEEKCYVKSIIGGKLKSILRIG